MRGRHQRGADNVSEFRCTAQHTSHRQHERDLHNLRRLEGEAADRNRHLRAVARRADNQHHALQQDAEGGEGGTPAHEVPDFIDEVRDDERECRRPDDDHELLHRFRRIEALEHDESVGEEKHRVVQQQPVDVPVKPLCPEGVQQEKRELQEVEPHRAHVRRLQIDDTVHQEVNQQDDPELPVAERIRVLLVRDGQISEIAVGVKHDQQELNVLRRRDKKIDHDSSSKHPSTGTLACANAGDRQVCTRPLYSIP